MKHNHRAIFLALAILLFLLAAGAVVLAQTSVDFNLEWHVIGSGGGQSSSADYQVNGTVGQGLASPPPSGSASYQVSSGYWFADTVLGIKVYVPALSKN
jgi:hypothetical protein